LRSLSCTIPGNGAARALLDRAEHATITGEVVLLGRISGTTEVRRVDTSAEDIPRAD